MKVKDSANSYFSLFQPALLLMERCCSVGSLNTIISQSSYHPKYGGVER
jgi:hypothetical protein